MSQSFIKQPDNGPHSALAGLGVLNTEPETMILNYEPGNGRSFWHSDCKNHFGGIVREVKREEDRSLMECLHCQKRGYYRKGWVGPHTVQVEAAAATTKQEEGGASNPSNQQESA